MKILLIEPPKPALSVGGEDAFIFEPLALEYIAASVRRDHDVRILDMRLDKDLPGILEEFRPHVVGLTAYTVHFSVVRKLCEQLKSWNPGVLTVVGGHHATVRPQDFLCADVDVVVSGDGVTAFAEIVERCEQGRGFEDLPGIDGAPAGRIVSMNSGLPGPLDDDPFPARDLTAAHRGHYYSEWMRPLASIRTSRGCPFRCSFCAEWKVAGGKYLRRSPERIVEELAEIREPYVFFADDESFVDAARMHSLAALRSYCRGLDLQFASFAVLTPLPGTDLWEETQERLLTDDTDYCDFIHTMLPTRLPIKEFYEEFHELYRSAVSVRNGPAFMRRYRWRDRWRFFRWARDAHRKLDAVHLDYAGMGSEQG